MADAVRSPDRFQRRVVARTRRRRDDLWLGLSALAAAMRRAAAAMVLVTGVRRTRVTCRRYQYAFAALALLAALLPLI